MAWFLVASTKVRRLNSLDREPPRTLERSASRPRYEILDSALSEDEAGKPLPTWPLRKT